MDRPHCLHRDACKAKTAGKHCPPCSSSSPEVRAKRSASIKAMLAANPDELERRRSQSRALSADADVIARRSAANTVTQGTPEMRAMHSARRKAFLAERMTDPTFVEMLRDQGRTTGRPNLRFGMDEAARAKAAPKIRAARLAWCPEEYWPLNATLKRKQIPLDERKRIIADEIERRDPIAQARKAIAAFDQQQRALHARQQREAY